MLNHPGHPYVHEKLNAYRTNELERRARARFAGVPASPAGAATRHAAAAALRRLADRLERAPGRPGLPQAGR